MTTLALTPPPLRRLFRRVDCAPLPRNEAVSSVLAAWRLAREGSVYPRPDTTGIDRIDPSGATAFAWEKLAGQRDYALMRGSRAVASLIGPMQRGARLSKAGDRRMAVRLRRLFEFVREAGEPVLAEFTGVDGEGRADTVVADGVSQLDRPAHG